MFGIQFFKSSPTEYVILSRKGKIILEGNGMSFFYYSPSSNIVVLPSASCDSPFIFKETTIDYQEINFQGQFTYRVLEPKKLAGLLNFSVDSSGNYTSDGMEKLPVRLTNSIQVALREKLAGMDLRTALKSGTEFVHHVKNKMKTDDSIISLGLEVMDFSILKISPTPDMSRALEATARETLLKEADEAIYVRRNFAVEQERKIKENELQTQISIEEKNKKIREEQMNIEIAVQEKKNLLEDSKMNSQKSIEEKKFQIEEQKLKSNIILEEEKKKLVSYQSTNAIELAKARAESLRLELEPILKLTPEVLEILSVNQLSSNQIISKAIRELAKNASKVGNLNISPELLTNLLQEVKK